MMLPGSQHAYHTYHAYILTIWELLHDAAPWCSLMLRRSLYSSYDHVILSLIFTDGDEACVHSATSKRRMHIVRATTATKPKRPKHKPTNPQTQIKRNSLSAELR